MTPIDRDWLLAHPIPALQDGTDKNARGRVLVVGGSMVVPGAIRLTGEAAFRAGAGKVQLAGPDAAATALGVSMPEAAVFGLPVNAQGELGEDAARHVGSLIERCDAVVLGPGTGPEAAAEVLLGATLRAKAPVHLLVDAGLLGGVPPLAERLRERAEPAVLTPHWGEMALLMECDVADVEADPCATACRAAERFGTVTVLKGGESWIATPDGTVLRYSGGGAGLGTGGSGDVLAGIIGGLLARGASPLVATAWGVWAHGEAGRILARRIGPCGFLARELIPEVPGLLV